jgi:hypothetical protein
VFRRALARYIAERHRRVGPFVDANYRLVASLRLHRLALGRDLLRAPVNAVLVAPHLALHLSAVGLRQVGARGLARRLGRRRLFLETEVGRELAWRLHVDLLELPYDDGRRRSAKDALAQAILAEEALAPWLTAEVTARLSALLRDYTAARSGASELVGSLVLAGAGAGVLQQLTPGALSLGPALAGSVAQQAAVAAFPLGAGLGSLWYGLVPAAPSAGLIAGTTAGAFALAAVLTAFSGIVTDPLMRAAGLHQRRLHRFLDALNDVLGGDGEAAFHVRDHYAARIFDLIDAASATARLTG